MQDSYKFECEHPDIHVQVDIRECPECMYYHNGCKYMPKQNTHPSSEQEGIDEIKSILNANSNIRETLVATNNVGLWEDYLKLELAKYISLIEPFRRAKNKEIPRVKIVKKELVNLKKMTESLKSSLDNLSNHAVAELLIGDTGDAYLQLETSLARFFNLLTKVIENVPADRGGRPENLRLKDLVERLSRIWNETTGKKPTVTWDVEKESYKSPFLKFVQLSCDLIGLEYSSLSALAQTIKRTLP